MAGTMVAEAYISLKVSMQEFANSLRALSSPLTTALTELAARGNALLGSMFTSILPAAQTVAVEVPALFIAAFERIDSFAWEMSAKVAEAGRQGFRAWTEQLARVSADAQQSLGALQVLVDAMRGLGQSIATVGGNFAALGQTLAQFTQQVPAGQLVLIAASMDSLATALSSLGGVSDLSNIQVAGKNIGSLAKLPADKLSALADVCDDLAEALASFSNVPKATNITAVTTALTEVGKLPKGKLDSLVSTCLNLAPALVAVADIKSTGDLGSIASALTKLGEVDAAKLKAVAAACGKLQDGLSKLASVKQGDLGKVANDLNKIAGLTPKKLEGLADACNKLAPALSLFSGVTSSPGINQIAGGLERISSITAGRLDAKASEIAKLAPELQKLSGVGAAPSLTKIATGLERIAAVTAGRLQAKAAEIAKLVPELVKLAAVPASPNLASLARNLAHLASLSPAKLNNLANTFNNLAIGLHAFAGVPGADNAAKLIRSLVQLSAVSPKAIKDVADACVYLASKLSTLGGYTGDIIFLAAALQSLAKQAQQLQASINKIGAAPINNLSQSAGRGGIVLTALGAAGVAAGGLITGVFKRAADTLANFTEIGITSIRFVRYLALAVIGLAATADRTWVIMRSLLRGTAEAAGFSVRQITEMTKALSEATGTSDRMSRSVANILLSFGAIRGDVFKGAMATLPDFAAAMGKTLPEAAQILGQALQDPANSLKDLRALGITVPHHMQQAFRQAAEGSQTAWLLSQRFILQAIARTAKGAQADLDTTLAGAVDRAKGAFVNLGDALAPALTPAVNAVLGVVNTMISLVNNNKTLFVSIGEGIAIAANSFGNFMKIVVNFISSMSPALQKSIGAFIGFVPAISAVMFIFLKLAGVFAPFVSAILSIINPFNHLVHLAIAVGLAITYAFNSAQFAPRMIAAWNMIKDAVVELWAKLRTVGSIVWDIIQPAWDRFVGSVVTLFERVASYVDGAKGDFSEWANIIGEIVGGAINFVLDVWTYFFESLADDTTWIGATWRVLWDTASTVFKNTFDFLSLVFTDWKLALEIGWIAIQLAAGAAFDFIKDGFVWAAGMVTGVTYAMVVMFGSAFRNITAAWDLVIGSIKVGIFGAWDAFKAILKGKNPIKAFAESVDKGIDELKKSRSKFSETGKEMGEAFEKGFEKVSKEMGGESEFTKKKREELETKNKELNDKRDRGRAERESNQTLSNVASSAKNFAMGIGTMAKALASAGGKPEEVHARKHPPMIEVKLETVGFADMWKKVQESMGVVSMQQLTENIAKKTEETASNTQESNIRLDRINETLGNLGSIFGLS